MSLLFSYLKTIYQDKKNISYIHEKSQNIYSLHTCTMPLHGNALFVHFKKGGTMRIHFPDEKLKKETFANQQSVNKTRFVCKGFVSAVPPVKQISSFLGFYAMDAPVRMFLLRAHGKGL